MNRNKLLFNHEEENGYSYTKIEVYACTEKPGCQIIEMSDTVLGDLQRMHLSASARAALVEALQS